MSRNLTLKQTAIALAVGMFGMMSIFYLVMISSGEKHDLLEWLLPAILFIGVFLLLPVVAVVQSILGRIVVLPFLAIWALIEHMKRRKSSNKAPDATSEPAPGADSSAHQG